MKRSLRDHPAFAVALALMIVWALPALAATDQAPTGTYKATTGSTAATASGAGATAGAAAAGGVAGAGGGTKGYTVTMNVSSYSSDEEIEELKALVKDPAAFLKTLNGFRHGNVKLGNRSVPIHAAYSIKKGGKYHIFLLSAKSFDKTPSRVRAKGSGAAAGYIRLTVDGDGDGSGMMYATAQVVFKVNGEIVARAGASTATKLNEVHR
ncbi:MAG: hypothetical protein GY856_09385 [bacterium]|nr:hypothetical protein [bacterium]